jgi:hypothetical protein
MPVALATAALMLVANTPASAYLKLGVRAGGRTVNLKWNRFPVRYFVTNRDGGGVTASQLQSALVRSFAAWQGVPTANLSSEFVGFTSADPFDDDSVNVMGFLSRPELERTLAATTFNVDSTTGEIIESDIFFNSTFPWSVADAGQIGRFDVESIATHEIGHLFGLSHSALGETEIRPTGGRRVIAAEAVMFPIAFAAGSISDRTLKADDIAGISDIYQAGDFARTRGSIRGTVRKNGSGVFGAHITAFNLATSKLVGGFTLNEDGSFVIAGLEPGAYVVRVEPLDDGDIDSFFDSDSDVDLDFRVAFAQQLAIVPAGGSTPSIEISVVPK